MASSDSSSHNGTLASNEKYTFDQFKSDVVLFDSESFDTHTVELYHHVQPTHSLTDITRQFRGVVYVHVHQKTDPLWAAYHSALGLSEKKESENHDDHSSSISSPVLVCRSFFHVPDVNLDTASETELETLIGKAKFMSRSHEGTVIRLFYAHSKWYISTHKKLDAYRSRWAGSKTFGEIFEECWARVKNTQQTLRAWMEETLQKDRCYIFLAADHPENRIVCRENEPLLFHLSTLVRNEQGQLTHLSREDILAENLGIPLPERFPVPSSVNELRTFVNNLDPFSYQGVLLSVNDDTHIKVLNPQYTFYSDLRGNRPSIRFRYLELRREGNDTRLKSFMSLYPEHNHMFLKLESDLNRIAIMLHNVYMNRYIAKNFIMLPKEEHVLLKRCHEWHCTDRSNHKVYLDKVKDVLKDTDAPLVNRILQHYYASKQYAPSSTLN